MSNTSPAPAAAPNSHGGSWTPAPHMSVHLLTSRLLPVPHGFATRAGGVSGGEHASLNLGFQVGDVPARVEENHRLLMAALGLSPGSLRWVDQVHGERVLEAPWPQDPAWPPAPLGEADALWTRAPGVAVGVRWADCVPLLLVDPRLRRVGAVHSGWRGTLLRVAARAVEALVAHGSRPAELLAAIGPHIRGCCYAVSPELIARFRGAFGAGVIAEHDRVELGFAVHDALLAAGLRPEHVDLSTAACTACEPERFFSHRRDQGRTGRHLAVVACRFGEGRLS